MRNWIFVIVVFLLGGSFTAANAQCNACEKLTNRVVNGDFENGNTGFTSELNYVTFFPFVCTLCPENNYAIGNNATLFHNDFTGNDHTNPPSGDFFIANAPGVAGTSVWCQSLTVFPNTEYTFTFWARDITDNPNAHPLATLIPTFNGLEATDTLVAAGGWSSLTTVWNSGNATTLDLCIIDMQWQTGGNDFGLDDISLSACEPIVLAQNAFAGVDTDLCSNVTLTLGQPAANGYAYTWSNAAGLSSTTAANPTLTLTNIGDTVRIESYIVTRDSANVGCVARDTVKISILPIHEVDLGADLSICPLDSVSLSIPNVWDTQTWFDGSTELSVMVGTGEYWVEVTDSICSKTDTISIAPLMVLSTQLPDSIAHCNTASLTLDGGFEGNWTGPAVSGPNPIEAAVSGTYYFAYTMNGCDVIDTVEVLLYDQLFAELQADTVLCEGTSLQLTAQAQGTWNTGVFSESLTVFSPDTFSIAVANGPCITRDTVLVTGILQPRVWLGNDSTFCEDNPLLLDASAPQNVSYLWSTGDTTHSITTAGSDIYRVEVSNTCATVADEITITNYPCSWQLYVPSSFTPNDDTFNEGWYVTGYNIASIDLRIYNRMGDAIFRTTTWEEPWKPGEAIGDDIYNYRINATTFNGEQVIRTGIIYLLR